MKLQVEVVRAALQVAVRANPEGAAALVGRRVGIEVPNERFVVGFEAGEDGRVVLSVVADSVAECDATLRISIAGLLSRFADDDAASVQGDSDVMADFLALLRPRLPLPEGLPSPNLGAIGEDVRRRIASWCPCCAVGVRGGAWRDARWLAGRRRRACRAPAAGGGARASRRCAGGGSRRRLTCRVEAQAALA